MSPDSIISLVGSLGFPIVCCGALFFQQNKTMKEFSDKIEQSIKELANNLDSNTIAVKELTTTVSVITKLGRDFDG